jgi:repressor LexA
MNLTPKQLHIYKFIKTFRNAHDYSPTLEEIAVEFGVSKITVLQHLRALEKRGAIRRGRYQVRGIEVREPSRSTKSPTRLPLVGVIAAGEPIEAIEDRETLEISDLVGGRNDPFLLRVRGDSMIDEQIRDGDYVVCERRTAAHNGETVVAIIDEEATLKRFYRERGGRVRLQPANQRMKPIYPKRVEIRGVVIGILRKY